MGLCQNFPRLAQGICLGVGDGEEEEGTELGMHIEQVGNIHSLSANIGFLSLQQYIVTGLKTGLAREKKRIF